MKFICHICKKDATTSKGIIYVRVGTENKPCCETCYSTHYRRMK